MKFNFNYLPDKYKGWIVIVELVVIYILINIIYFCFKNRDLLSVVKQSLYIPGFITIASYLIDKLFKKKLTTFYIIIISIICVLIKLVF